MMERDLIRELATRFRIAAHDRHDDALIDIRAADVSAAANILATPTWFSANELRIAADAMDILGVSTADGWTLRARLDAFWKTGPVVKNAESFAAYLHNTVKHTGNGGIQ